MLFCSENCLEKGNQEYIASEAFVKSDFASPSCWQRITLAWELQSRAHRAGTGWPVLKSYSVGTSLLVQWIRIRLPMQGTWVQSLVQEDSTCNEQLSPGTTTTEPASHKYSAYVPQQARAPRAWAPQQEKPPQWEALCAITKDRSHSQQLKKASTQHRQKFIN